MGAYIVMQVQPSLVVDEYTVYYLSHVSKLFYKCCIITGHIGFWIRIESATKTTAEAFQPANTCGRDADTMPVEVLRGG